jgi:hypothetical protein
MAKPCKTPNRPRPTISIEGFYEHFSIEECWFLSLWHWKKQA